VSELPTNPNKISRPFGKIEGDVSRIYGIKNGAKYVAEPMAELTAVAHIGFVDTPAAADGVRRVAPLLVHTKQGVFPSLSLQALLAYWKVPADDVRIRLGDGIYFKAEGRERRVPIDESGGYLVNYRREGGDDDPLKRGYYGLVQLLEKKYRAKQSVPNLPPLEGRILLVGQASTGLSDNGPTPFSAETPLVMVHANVVENILREDYARRPPPWTIWLGAFALGLFGLGYFSDRRLASHVLFSVGVVVVYAFASIQAWNTFSLWLPLVAPTLGFVAVQVFALGRRVLSEQKAKAQIKGMFGTYISPELVNRMVESGESPKLGGHEVEITAYFSDIQGYSTFSEKLEPERLVVLLNDYLTVCTDTIVEEGGTLDKYIGDAVVAMFGAPITLPDHACRACVAALRVQHQLAALRARWNADTYRWPEGVLKMQSRIGLNTGPAIIGNMGSRTRFNYTMTGDNVNLAARMESGAKSWGAYTMCTEATKLACEQHGGERVIFRALGRIVVMGRTLPVPIFEAVGLKENTTDSTRECIAVFEAALANYYAGDWAGAIAGFTRSAGLEPNQPGVTPGVKTNPSLVYADIARHYSVEPPPENWGGVYVMKEK
jgi:adenylate cyclase